MSKKHYKLSPSASKRWMNCPGSLKLSRGIPNKDSVYSIEGTQAHDVAETCFKKACRAAVVAKNKDTADAVQVYLDELQRVRDSVQLIVEHSERKLKCTYLDDLGGTSDHMMAYVEDGRLVLHIFDYKHGAGVPVDVYENHQMLSYMLITESHYPGMFDLFRATVVQPRCFAGDAIQTWTCDADRLEQHHQEILKAITQEHLAAGEWCQFCPAMSICPEVRERAFEAAQMEFSEIRDDVDELLRLEKLAPAITKLLNSVETFMLDKFRDGSGGIPGRKVVERRSHRRWKLADKTRVQRELESLGLTPKQFIESKLKTPPQVEKELPKERRKELADLCETMVIGWKVVPVTGKGKAVDFNDVSEFSTITE